MVDDDAANSSSSSHNCNENCRKTKEIKTKKKKKKNKRGGSKRKMTTEQSIAFKSVIEWVYLDQQQSNSVVDDFGVLKSSGKAGEKVVFEFHSHSNFSDGFLSPSKLVERAHGNGVKVLALTDHDTMYGVPEAIEAARRFGIKIIPGVEISAIFSSSGDSHSEEPVHILAYYSSCGPAKFEQLEKFLENIREGRFLRAKNIVSKLNDLKLPLKWDHVARITGKGVAPGRLHVARAMVEAGYVENLKEAFSRYLFDGGPAYSTGSEPSAEEAIQLIHDTGGVAVLAHPWALKNPVAIIRRLKDAGLHGLEVYRSNGKLAAYSDLADTYGLLKLGGSDFHGRGGHNESNLGSVNLPVLVMRDFLEVARPIWCRAIRDNLERYAEEPSDSNLAKITRYGRTQVFKGGSSPSSVKDLIDRCLTLWLTNEEKENVEFEALRVKLSHIAINYEVQAKRKEAWLIEKLRKFEVSKSHVEKYDPEILTEEEKHYLKRIGEKKKNFVLLGRRGVFGGVVLNMHLHWKKHETVKVICKPCKPGQVDEFAEEIARLSKGIAIDIKPNNTIIFYRGKNYVQPKVMSPPDTLSKDKALEKFRFEQSLEHTSQFIEKLEKELEEYQKHLARFKRKNEDTGLHPVVHS